jgi:dTDP-L-rhamnose 4-epimerase
LAATNKFRAGDIRHCYADITRLSALRFRPAVALKDGLRSLVDWGKGQAAEDRVEAAAQELEQFGLVTGT